MGESPTERRPPGGWAPLEPYAAVLRALLPRMSGVSVFNARGEVHWSSEMAVGPELSDRVAETLRVATATPTGQGQQCLIGDEPTYLFWLRREEAPEDAPFAVVAIALRPATESERELRSFAFVHALARPALECLRRELVSRSEILTLHSSLLEQDNDLEMLLSVTGGDADAKAEQASDLKAIVVSATEHLKVALAALIVPEKSIALLQPAEGTAMDTSLVARAHRHLMSMSRVRRKAAVVNHLVLGTGPEAAACRVLACPIYRPDGRWIGVLALFRSESAPEFTTHHARLSELLARRIASVIEHSYDSLTGLLTRPAFEQRVALALGQPRSARSWWSALYIDINRLHVINDNYGMHVGDRVIGQLGEMIRSRLPPGAIATHISGDRFAILLPASLSDAAKFAEALRTGAETLGAALADGSLQVSISIGVSAVDPRSQEFVHAFAAAETACKAANDRGRNRVELYQEADESLVRRFTDINLIRDLRGAIAENRLQLEAQLIAPLGRHGGRPHFEILLRMASESGQIIGPDHFISAATRYQLMPDIDHWVIERTLELLKPHAALLQNAAVVFAINFSGQSLQHAGFIEDMPQLVQASGICPAALCFELTESAAIANLSHAEGLMRRLRALGCGVALDDFGAGLSSLAYLRTLPINMLKIDGSFVRDALKDVRAESMIQTIAQLARAMKLVTVAEYVETEELRTRITALQVDYGQGFAIAKPVPLQDVLAELPLYAASGETSTRTRAAGLSPAVRA